MNLQKSCLFQDFPLRSASHPCFMACGAAQPSQSPLAWLSGVQALVGRGNGGALVGRGDCWGAGPCATAAVGLSEAGGRSWLGNAGEAGEPALQMGSRWLVLAFPGLRSELLITRSPSPPSPRGTPPRCVASPLRAGRAVSKELLPCW